MRVGEYGQYTAQGGVIIRFSGTEEAKNEIGFVFRLRVAAPFSHCRENRERKREEKYRKISTNLFFIDDGDSRTAVFFLPSFGGGSGMIMESIEENHYRVHRREKEPAGVIIKFP